MSSVTVAMPHTIPSMVSTLRVRFRRNAVQASVTICPNMFIRLCQNAQGFAALAASFVSQGFYRINRRRTSCRIERRNHRNHPQEKDRHDTRLPCRQQTREEIWHGHQVDQSTEPEGDCEPSAAADECNHQCFDKKLL